MILNFEVDLIDGKYYMKMSDICNLLHASGADRTAEELEQKYVFRKENKDGTV